MSKPWTEEMIDRLRVLAAKGETALAIGMIMSGEFGTKLTRNSIIGKMQRAEIVSANSRKPNLEWTDARVNRLRVLASKGLTVAEISAKLKFWSAKAIRTKCRAERIKVKAHKAPAKPKTVAPPMVTGEVPFLPPAELVVEYVPLGVNPKPFLEAGQFDCQYILPGQDDKPAPERLVCANPVNFASRFRFCAACGERLTTRATVVRIREPKPNGARPGRKRSALTGAQL
jgi:hypothetical protein